MPKTIPYPAWICHACGVKYGRRIPTLATWHIDRCGVCGKRVMVTEPRDYGHLRGATMGNDTITLDD